MALRQPVYLVTIRGAGPGFHAAYAALERSIHLEIAQHYLVDGDEARVAIMAHHGQGNVRVTAELAGASDARDEARSETDVAEIEAFVQRIAGAPILWDEAWQTWSLPGFAAREIGGPASTHLEATLEALRAVLATQKR